MGSCRGRSTRSSMLADREGAPILKATALFLSMTLYGDVARFVEGAYRPAVMVSERQCLADSLTYAKFYLPLLTGPLEQAHWEPLMAQALGPAGMSRLMAWVPVFQAREAQAASPVSFWALPLFIRDLFKSPPEVLLSRLKTLYHAEMPDLIILLTLSPEALAERHAQKQGAAPREIHEQAQVLAMFQAGLKQSCEALVAAHAGTRLAILDAAGQSVGRVRGGGARHDRTKRRDCVMTGGMPLVAWHCGFRALNNSQRTLRKLKKFLPDPRKRSRMAQTGRQGARTRPVSGLQGLCQSVHGRCHVIAGREHRTRRLNRSI